ncbi:MAG: hypothetical protein ACPGJS_20335 [Flammeovirgaceae bacterium]
MKQIPIIFFILMMFTHQVTAQNEPIEKLLKDYIKELNALGQTKNLDKLKPYFDKNFKTNQTFIGLGGTITRSSGELKDFMKELANLTTDSDVKMNLEIAKIHNVIQGDKNATLSAVINMEIVVDGKSYESSVVSTSVIARKNEKGEWKFVHFDNIRTVKGKAAGKCISYFYERPNSYVVAVLYPGGIEYLKSFEHIFIKTKGGQSLLNTDYGQYTWTKGKVMNPQNEEIGSATTEKEAISLLLKNLYKGNCITFITK